MRSRDARGFTLIELMVVVGVIGILASIGVAQVMKARVAANATAALGSLRAVNGAQQAYAQQCHGFAHSLTELRLAGNFLSPDMTASDPLVKGGYQFVLAPGIGDAAIAPLPPGCTGSGTTYYATAEPLALGTSGSRSFATNEQGTIFYTLTAVAPPEATFGTTALPVQ